MRNELSIVMANEGHAHLLAPRIRCADLEEIAASHGVAPLLGLLDAVRASSYCRAAMLGEEVVALFGIVQRPEGAGEHIPASVWMIASDLAERHPGKFWRACKAELPRMLEHASPLMNHIDARNHRSLRWAWRLGFTLLQNEPVFHGERGEFAFIPVLIGRK